MNDSYADENRERPGTESSHALTDSETVSTHSRLVARVRALRTSHRAMSVDILVVFGIALAVRLIWAVVMPPWQATDETEHFAYINHLAEQHAIPSPPFDKRYDVYSIELQASLDNTLFYPLVQNNRFFGEPSTPLPTVYDYRIAREYSARGEDRFDSGHARAGPYPPLYYLLMTVPDLLFAKAPIISRLFAIRASTGLLGALSCVFAYLMACELRGTRRWGWAVGLCVAFMPTYAHLTASVNNDAGVDFGAMLLLWLAAALYRRRTVPLKLASAVGTASGLTMLMKPSAVPVIAITGLLLLWRANPYGVSLQSVRERVFAIGAYALTGCLTYIPWLSFRLAHGEGLVFANSRPLIPPISSIGMSGAVPLARIGGFSPTFFLTEPYSLGSYLRYFAATGEGPYVFREFWARFGWGGAFLPDWAISVVGLCCAIGTIGLALQFIFAPAYRGAILLLASFVLLQNLFLFLGLEYYVTYARTGVGYGLQGRYFFPLLLPLLFLILSGWHYLFRMNPRVLRLAPLVMFALQIVGLSAVVARYYGVAIG